MAQTRLPTKPPADGRPAPPAVNGAPAGVPEPAAEPSIRRQAPEAVPPSPRTRWTSALDAAVGVVFLGAAFGLTALILEVTDTATQLPLVVAIMAAAWYRGWVGGVVALIGALVLSVMLNEPRYAPEISDDAEVVRLLLLAGVGAGITAVFARTHSAEAERAVAMAEAARRLREQTAARAEADDAARRYRMLAESSPMLVWVVQSGGAVEYFNNHFFQYTGLTHEQAYGHGWEQAIHPDDLRLFLERRQATDGEPPDSIQIEARLRTAEGDYRWHNAHLVPMRGPDGAVHSWLGTAVDIDDRKRAAAAVAESERRFRGLADTVPALLWVSDPRGACLYVNEPWLELTGQTLTDALGDGWMQAIHHADRQHARDALAQAIRTRAPMSLEYRLRRHDGDYCWILDRARPSFDATGALTGYIGSCVDISDRKAAEQKLRTREAQQAAVAKISALGLSSASLDDLFDVVVRELAGHLDVEYAEVLELLPGGERLRLRGGVGWNEGLVGSATVDTGQNSQAGYTLQVNRPVIVADLAAETRFNGPALLRDHGVASGMSTVIRAGQRAWGVLGIHTRERRQFSEDDLQFLESVSNVIGQAIVRTETEAALRESEERLRIAQDAAGMGTWDWNVRTNELKWSDALGPMHGFPPGEFPGTFEAYIDSIHPDDRERVLNTIQQALDGNDARFQMENRVLWPDGQVRWIIGQGAVVRDAEGRAVRLVGVGIDVTRERRAEEALRASEAALAGKVREMEALLSIAPVGIGIARDPECRRIDANAEFARLLRLDPVANSSLSAPAGERPSFRIFRDGRELEPAELPIQVAARTGEGTEPQQLDIVFDDGSVMHEYGMAEPLRDAQGNVVGAIGAFMDVTARVRAERRQADLGDISRELAARSVDRVAQFDYVATRLRDLIGDAAIVLMARDDRPELEIVAVRHRDEEGEELIRQIASTRPPRTDEGLSARIFETGKRIFVREMPADTAEQTPEDHRVYLDRYGVGSTIMAPLKSGGRVVGELAVVRGRGSAPYAEDDAVLVGEIAERASAALELATLYERQRETTRELAEALAASEYELRLRETITENTAVGLMMVDSAARITYLNPAGERITGMSFEYVRGRTVHDCFHWKYPDGRPFPGDECAIERANRELSPLKAHEDVFVRPDGTYYDVVCNVAPLVQEGTRIGSLIEVQDVTAERRARLAVRDSEQRLEGIIQSAMDALITIDESQTIRVFNRAAEETFGCAADEAIGGPLDRFIPERFRGVHRNHIAHFGETGATSRSMRSPGELLGLRADGQEFPIEATISNIESGGERLYTVIVRDITERKRASETLERLYEQAAARADELRRANAAKDEFLGLVSHELRTPITTILGNAEILERRRDLLAPEERSAALRDIAEEGERLYRIIENMLILARLDQGYDLETEPILLRRVIESIVAEHRRRFPHRRVNFDGTDVDVTPVAAERGYIEQVMRNLLSNAEKYSPASEPIDVSIERTEAEICVSVMDRGPGISDEEAEHIFSAFYRSPTTATKAAGVGIGLTVCRRLVEAQGGRIWARAREGGGAEVGFALPVTEDEVA